MTAVSLLWFMKHFKLLPHHNKLAMFQVNRSFPALIKRAHGLFNQTSNSRSQSNTFSSVSNNNGEDKFEPLIQINAIQSKDEIITEKYGAITIISLNRPEEQNIITREMATKLTEAITTFENDGSASIGILHGVGGNFSAGFDLNELSADLKEPAKFLTDDGFAGPTRRIPKKPMICGISGSCLSAGFELALMCDLRIIETTAVLGFCHRKNGVPIMDGGTVRLPSIVGLARALDIIMTGREVTASEAYDMGLAWRVVAPGSALGQAINLATSLVKFPQATLNHDRNAVYASLYGNKSFEQSCLNEVMGLSKGVLSDMARGLDKDRNDLEYMERFIPDWEKEEIRREQELDRRRTKK